MERAMAGAAELMEYCVAVGGALSGEHGIGLEKKQFMPLVFTEEDLDAMRRVRAAFAPENRLNPGTHTHTHTCTRSTNTHVQKHKHSHAHRHLHMPKFGLMTSFDVIYRGFNLLLGFRLCPESPLPPDTQSNC